MPRVRHVYHAVRLDLLARHPVPSSADSHRGEDGGSFDKTNFFREIPRVGLPFHLALEPDVLASYRRTSIFEGLPPCPKRTTQPRHLAARPV